MQEKESEQSGGWAGLVVGFGLLDSPDKWMEQRPQRQRQQQGHAAGQREMGHSARTLVFLASHKGKEGECK